MIILCSFYNVHARVSKVVLFSFSTIFNKIQRYKKNNTKDELENGLNKSTIDIQMSELEFSILICCFYFQQYNNEFNKTTCIEKPFVITSNCILLKFAFPKPKI